MSETDNRPTRSYGCSFGDGNPYDFIVVTASDMSTLALCAGCFIRTASDMLTAMMEGDNPEVQRRIAEAGEVDIVPMDGTGLFGRGHNAPVETDSADEIERFTSFVLPDELPEEMKPDGQ